MNDKFLVIARWYSGESTAPIACNSINDAIQLARLMSMHTSVCLAVLVLPDKSMIVYIHGCCVLSTN